MVSLSTVGDTKAPETLVAAKPTGDCAAVILIVEDDDDNRAMLKTVMGMWNYRVIEAEDGETAVRIAEEVRPDLILMDFKLPRLDGVDATQRIRQSAKISGVPVIFLSGCAEANYRKAADNAGGNEYLVKPLDLEELQNTLGKYLNH